MNILRKYVAIGLLSVVGLSACGGDSATSNGGGGTAPAAMSNADLLKAAIANMKAAKSYSVCVGGISSSSPITMSGSIDVVNKNSSLTMQSGGNSVVATTIMSDTYTSLDGGKTFTKGPSAAGGFVSFTSMWTKAKPEEIDKAKYSLKDGTPATETIDGVATKHMTADAAALAVLSPSSNVAPNSTTATPDAGGSVVPSPTVESVTGMYDIWVSTDATPTVRQLKRVGKLGGVDSSFIIKWSKINEAVNIKAPPTTP